MFGKKILHTGMILTGVVVFILSGTFLITHNSADNVGPSPAYATAPQGFEGYCTEHGDPMEGVLVGAFGPDQDQDYTDDNGYYYCNVTVTGQYRLTAIDPYERVFDKYSYFESGEMVRVDFDFTNRPFK